MIEVENLAKFFGSVRAVDGLSFSLNTGEIVGLLGPNGAGKTTLLRILTGYLPATQGAARLAGLDILEQSLEIRRRIGYLPETNPLYEDLAVHESLEWTGRLRGMEAGALKDRIRQVVEICGLREAVGRDVGTLSKGYRQRLGLAQAILHDPEILILDEPTSGLDPNQQQEVRQLIQTLKQKKTVLLSTHILPEAQSACDRVLIMHKGKIVADGTPESLGRQTASRARLAVSWKAPEAAAEEALRRLPGVEHVSRRGESDGGMAFYVETAPGRDVREAVFELASANRWPLLHLAQETASLEEIFRQLTTEGKL